MSGLSNQPREPSGRSSPTPADARLHGMASRTPQADEAAGGPTIGRLLRVARRNMLVLILCATALPVAAFVLSERQQRQYTATASLLFRDPEVDRAIFGEPTLGTSQDPERASATNLKLARLDVVASRTASTLRESGVSAADVKRQVDVTPNGTSDLVNIAATDPDPRFAANLATTFALEFIRYRRDADRAKVSEARQLVQRRLDSLPPEEAESGAARELQTRAEQLDIVSSLQTGNAELAEPAAVPSSPSSPQVKRNVALAIVLGLMLGAGLVVLREQLDRRLRDEEDVVEVFGLPVLASVPESSALRQRVRDRSRYSPETEAFLMLRANLRYFNVDRRMGSILVTSPAARDGKTTVAWNLAVAEARSGESVLLVEADLRRPSLTRFLGVQPTGGLSEALTGIIDVEWALAEVDGVDVLFAGAVPPNPASLIESEAMSELLRRAPQEYDRVIIDTPPMARVADAIPLMSAVGGVVVVVRLGHTEREEARRLRSQLAHIDAPVLGLAINSAPSVTDYYASPLRPSPAPQQDRNAASENGRPQVAPGSPETTERSTSSGTS
jgi:receptor protein-tyrosine kinase